VGETALISLLQAGVPLVVVVLMAAVWAFTSGRVYSRDAMERQRAETDRERQEKEDERKETDRWVSIAFNLVQDGTALKRGALDAVAEAKVRLPDRKRRVGD
jgi:flagellar biosynthesis component FlhA